VETCHFIFFGRGRGEFRFRMFLAIGQSKWPIAPPKKKKKGLNEHLCFGMNHNKFPRFFKVLGQKW
jgi:hypothetical protein